MIIDARWWLSRDYL